MSQINKKEIEYLANLSKLILTEQEKEMMVQDLNKIKTFFETLQQLDTEKIEPLTSLHALQNALREDTPNPFQAPETLLKQGDKNEPPFFTVPTVINKSK